MAPESSFGMIYKHSCFWADSCHQMVLRDYPSISPSIPSLPPSLCPCIHPTVYINLPFPQYSHLSAHINLPISHSSSIHPYLNAPIHPATHSCINPLSTHLSIGPSPYHSCSHQLIHTSVRLCTLLTSIHSRIHPVI